MCNHELSVAFSTCLVFVVLIPMGILQNMGYAGGTWISTDNCTAIGLWTKCCNGYGEGTCKGVVVEDVEAIDFTVYKMQKFSTYVFWTSLLGILYPCVKETNRMLLIIVATCVLLYPIGASVSFLSCMVVMWTYEPSQLGQSFYYCLTASSAAMFAVLVLTVSQIVSRHCECCSGNTYDLCHKQGHVDCNV